jgi:iron complex outermembrane receptor protein
MIKNVFLSSLILLFSGALTFAQTVTGSVSGTVTIGDAVLHDAEVHILQLKRSVRTDETGTYKFADVPPGRYAIIVHKEGFADASTTVQITAGTEITANFRLTLASISEQVTVTASGTEQTVFESFQTVNSVGSTRIASDASDEGNHVHRRRREHHEI